MAQDILASYDKWIQKLDSQRGTYGKLPLGTTKLRILPWFRPTGEFWVEQLSHFNFRADRRPIPCRRPSQCACCEKSDQLARAGKDEEANRISWRVNALVNAVDLGHPENGVRIYTLNMGTLTGIMKYCRDKGINMVDPDNGADIPFQVEKQGTSNKTFAVTAFIQTSPLPNKEWLKEMFDLTKLNRGCTYEQQQAMLRGENVKLGGASATATGPDPAAEFQQPIPQESTPFRATGTIPANASLPVAPTPTTATSSQPTAVRRNWKDLDEKGTPKCFGNHADEHDTPDQTIVCETCKFEQDCQHRTLANQFPADKGR